MASWPVILEDQEDAEVFQCEKGCLMLLQTWAHSVCSCWSPFIYFHLTCTVRPLLSNHPRDFEKWPLNRADRLTDVQYKLHRKGSKHDFIASIQQNAITTTTTITIIYLTTLTSKSTKCSFKIRTCIKLSKIDIHMKY